MSDADIRSLERLASTGDAYAIASLERIRTRIGVRKPILGEWHTCYADLPHGGFYARVDASDYRTVNYIETVEVMDLDSASGAVGLVLVEKRTTSLEFGSYGRSGMRGRPHKYAGLLSAMESSSLPIDHNGEYFGAESVRFALAQGLTPIEARERIIIQLAECQTRYGHAHESDDGTIIVWHDRPEARKDLSMDEMEWQGEITRARHDREEQRASWDSFRPTGFHKGTDGQNHMRMNQASFKP
jgi:hypothetical protein